MKIVSSELNKSIVENLKEEILKELTSVTTSLTLDFTDVKKIDLSIIQLLISLKKYCVIQDISLEIINISAKQVKQSMKMFNVKECLGVVS
jgi:ABC-type transporter Mla MlaB component